MDEAREDVVVNDIVTLTTKCVGEGARYGDDPHEGAKLCKGWKLEKGTIGLCVNINEGAETVDVRIIGMGVGDRKLWGAGREIPKSYVRKSTQNEILNMLLRTSVFGSGQGLHRSGVLPVVPLDTVVNLKGGGHPVGGKKSRRKKKKKKKSKKRTRRTRTKKR